MAAKQAKQAKQAKKGTFWMSKDSWGSDSCRVYIWSSKPDSHAGTFCHDESEIVDYFDSDCDEFLRFCRIFGVKKPEPGQCLKITLGVQSMMQLSSAKEVSDRLRSAKKFDPKLLKEAATWVESIDVD